MDALDQPGKRLPAALKDDIVLEDVVQDRPPTVLRIESALVYAHIKPMVKTKKSTQRALRASAPRKTAESKTAAAPASAYVSAYAVGDHISHPVFGDGTVTAIDVKKLTIEFPESVTKQIIDGYVKHRRA